MSLQIQFAIKNNPYYTSYLRNNSYWYKILNRNPKAFKDFEEQVKTYYHLRPSDRLENAINTINIVTNLMSNLK